jgi:uncharacterized membrane protein YeaQ/YmgE (transglycosylase-associated protein family)
MWNIISTIIVGFIAGWLARVAYPGGVPAGWILTTLLGIGGSFVGTIIGGMFTKEKDMMSLKPAGFIMSVIGAFILIFVAHRLGLR